MFPQNRWHGVSQLTYAPSVMASQGKLYTLCGFTEELDWRPLHFVEPVPAHRICGACGVLPRKTAFLPCRDVLCKRCYEQCVLDDGHACLLDGDQFLPEDAEWRDFPLENLLRRKIKCWNEERGCDVVLPASELNKHFCNDCEHHATSCPKCSKLVLRSNVSAHLQSKCRDYAASPTSSVVEKSHSEEKAMMALTESLDVGVVEIKHRLDEVISGHTVQSDRLNDISHCINTVKEALLQRPSGNSTLDHLTSQCTVMLSSVREVEERLIDHSEETRVLSGTLTDLIKELKEVLQDTARTVSINCVGSVAGIAGAKDTEKKAGQGTLNKELALHTINTNRYEFMAKGYEAMKKRAYSEGFHRCSEEAIYLSGYHVSPGVRFKKAGDQVLLHPTIQLHKGVIDEFLQWPFSRNIGVTVKHPSQSKQCQKVWNIDGKLQFFGKPGETGNDGAFASIISFSLNDLEGEGYVEDDKLHIVWELLSKSVAK
ncbi:TNF receptor-associated factor 6-B-like isoform X3 [Dermacentor albipictus]|uniref:TNF receptor-associated factor 6-B-like isoform X3 n=1 Tax=Dermacentor albipictus TaxID=60249 RepID=UPI0038FCBE9D